MNDLRRGAVAWRVLIPVLLVAGLFAAYTAYWFYARGQIIDATQRWIADQAEAGYIIERDTLTVGGFPTSFDVVLTAPRIHGLDGDSAWVASAQRISAHALPYDFSHWVVDVSTPVMMEFGTTVRTIHRIETRTARISLSGNGESTQRLGVEIDGLDIMTLQGDTRPVQTVESLRLVAETVDGNALQVSAALAGVGLNTEYDGSPIRDSFGYQIEFAQVDLAIEHWPELARDGDIREWSNADGELIVESLRLDWGDLNMTMDGEVGLDTDLRPEGRMSLYFLDPALVASRLEESGMINSDGARALRLLAQAAPRDDRGSVLPLSLRRGGVYIGPVRLGEVGSLAGD